VTTEQILTVATEHLTGPVVLLTASGEIDHDSQSVLGDAAATALDRGPNQIVIDLTGVSFCDSGGLSLFVRMHQQVAARGGSVHLAALQDPVRQVIEVTNLDRLLTVHATVDQAVQAALTAG
jgi:anti-sigma B factor antagonist